MAWAIYWSKKLLYEADSEEIKITYEPFFIHPQEVYLDLNKIKKEHDSANSPIKTPPFLEKFER